MIPIKSAISDLRRRVFERLVPLGMLLWAEEYFYLSASATNTQGVRFRARGYQRAFLYLMGDLDIRMVVLIKGVQQGASQCAKAFALYEPSHRKRSIIYYVPRNSDVLEFSNVQLKSSLKDIPAVREQLLVDSPDRKDPDNTSTRKAFKDGQLHIKSAGVPENFTATNASSFIFDEADRAPRSIAMDAKQEGVNPMDLAWGRVAGERFKKGVYLSTASEDGTSNIQYVGSQCETKLMRHHQCPECGLHQELQWLDEKSDYGFKWDRVEKPDGTRDNIKTAKTIRYVCQNHECRNEMSFEEFKRIDGSKAEYRADNLRLDDKTFEWTDLDGNPADKPFSVFLQWRGWFSHETTWFDGCLMFLEACDAMKVGDFSPMRRWVQEFKSEPWVSPESAEHVQHGYLMSRQEGEHYGATIPDEAQAITKFWDVQGDRIECLTCAWGYGEECWLVSHSVYWGDPATSGVLENIQEHSKKTYTKNNGFKMPVTLSGVDSKWLPDVVNKYCAGDYKYKIIPTMGSSSIGKPIVQGRTQASKQYGTFLTTICPDTAKDLIYSRYRIETPGSGYIHIPDISCFDEKFIKQMVAEVKKVKNGVMRWVCGDGIRNEGLDLMVGNLAIVMLAQQRLGLTFIPKHEYQDKNNTEDDFDMSAMIKAAQA